MSNEIDGVNVDELAGLLTAAPAAPRPAAPRPAARPAAQPAPTAAPPAEEVLAGPQSDPIPPLAPAKQLAGNSLQDILATSKMPARGTRQIPGFEPAQQYDPAIDEEEGDEEWETPDPRSRSGQRTQQRPQRQRANDDEDDDDRDSNQPRIVEVSAADIRKRNKLMAEEAQRNAAAEFEERARKVAEAAARARAISEGRIPPPQAPARAPTAPVRPSAAVPPTAPAPKPATAASASIPRPAVIKPTIVKPAAAQIPLGLSPSRLTKFMFGLAGIGLRLTVTALEFISDETGVTPLLEKTNGLLEELRPNIGKLLWDGNKGAPTTGAPQPAKDETLSSTTEEAEADAS